MQYFGYLDWPQIPIEVLNSVTDIINLPTINRGKVNNDYFLPKHAPKIVVDWCQANLPPYDFSPVYYQVIPGNAKNRMPCHKDIGRILATNYIIQPGGNNVMTNIFDDDWNPIESVCIEPFRWHWLAVGKFHNVTNLRHTRISISPTMSPAYQVAFLSGRHDVETVQNFIKESGIGSRI